MRQSHRLIYNTGVSWGAKMLEALIQFLLLPFMIHRLGAVEYSIFILIYSATVIIDWISTGMGQSVVKYTSEYLSLNRMDKVNQVLGVSFAITSISGVIIFISLVSFSSPIVHFMDIDAEFIYAFQFSLIIMSFMILFNLLAMPYVGVLYGLQRYDVYSVLQTVTRMIRAISIVGYFLYYKPSIISLVVIFLITDILFQIMLVLITNRLLPNLRLSFQNFGFSIFKSLLNFGALIFLIQISMALRVEAVNWTIAKISEPIFLTYIAIMHTPAALATKIVQSGTLTIMPVASKYYSQGQKEIVVKLFNRATRYIFVICCSMAFCLVHILEGFLEIWMGDNYTFLTPYMVILTISALVELAVSPAHHILKGIGKLGAILFARILSGVICLITVIGGIIIFNSPLWAVTVGLSFAFLVSAYVQFVVCIKELRVKKLIFLWRTFGQTIISFVLIAFLSKIIIIVMGFDNIYILGIQACFFCVMFFVAFFNFFMDSDEKQDVQDIITIVRQRICFLSNTK